MHKAADLAEFSFYRNDMTDYYRNKLMTGKSIEELDEFFMKETKIKLDKFLKLAVKVLAAEKCRKRKKILT